MSKRKRVSKSQVLATVRGKPDWLIEFKRRTMLIDIIDMAFNADCGCIVCEKLRAAAEELGEVLAPPVTRRTRK